MRDLMKQAFDYTGEESDIRFQRIISQYPPHKRKKIAQDILRGSEERMASMTEFFSWAHDNRSFVLQPNDCSRLHDLKDASRDGRLLGTEGAIESDNALANSNYPQHTFVVKHDWARAFEHADGLDDSIKLPYDICSFEFRIGGRSIIAIAYGTADIKFTAFAQCGAFWACLGGGAEQELKAYLLKMIWNQIRAICIALDAEVATHIVERASNTLNKKRVASGKTPISDFHVVDLARLHRIENPSIAGTEGTKKRLHFRRGHWRHYELSKTWIRWCLVGDPDLGFIHKDYTI
jgi:hypothetical protein